MFKNIKIYAPFYLPLIVGSLIVFKGNNFSSKLFKSYKTDKKCYIRAKYQTNDKCSIDCFKISK